jgi:oxygen-independent coproporphyrinogen-3 oxidase
MGRRHNASQAKDAITNAQKVGFDNISIDLIYGIPNQTINDWQQDIEQALALEPQHLSAYCLTYENGTKLTQLLLDGKIQPVEDTTENEMYDYLVNTLAKHHYHHYEVSNFAKQTYESKHNSSYWTHTPYLGLGAGAHSYNNDTRWWNINDVNAYINATHFEDIQQKECLSKQDLRTERIMLGLRTANGIDTNEVDPQVVQKYINLGYLTLNNQRICATLDGYHILNRIIEDLI